MRFVKRKAMWPEVDRQKGSEQQGEVIYLCSQPCQSDEAVCFSSNVWYLCALVVLLTNNQAAAFTAQRGILEPLREARWSPLPTVFSTHWFAVAQVTSAWL